MITEYGKENVMGDRRRDNGNATQTKKPCGKMGYNSNSCKYQQKDNNYSHVKPFYRCALPYLLFNSACVCVSVQMFIF